MDLLESLGRESAPALRGAGQWPPLPRIPALLSREVSCGVGRARAGFSRGCFQLRTEGA